MSRKSNIETRVADRLIQLKNQRDEITMKTEDWLSKIETLAVQIEMLEEILTAPDGKETSC